MVQRALTREETKAITRRRLIDAALRILTLSGGRNLTASRVAREAGVAQPTFYVHFRDLDDLLRAVAEVQIAELRHAFQRARRRIDPPALLRGEHVAALRDAFRVPIETILSRPAAFRVYVEARQHVDTPLGRYCRRLDTELRRDLVEDLRALDRQRRRGRSERELAMLADVLIAMTEALALGLLEGRYKSIDVALDLIVKLSTRVLVQ